MMTTETISDRRTWLEERRQGVGASDVAAICGVPTAYGSPMSVWADKCNLIPIDDTELDGDDPRQFGKDLEWFIAARFERESGLHVRGRQQMVHYPSFKRWFATLDGFVFEGTDSVAVADELGVFESKYTAQPPWDELPEHYVYQVQWQMMCANLDHAWVAGLHLPFGRPRFRIYEVDRDPALIDRIQVAVTHFWNEHVVTGEPPPPDDHPATIATIDQLFAHLQTAKVPTLPLDDYRETIDRWTYWRTQRLDAEKHEKVAAAQLKAAFAGENPDLSEGTIGGELAVSWRSRPHVQFDIKTFREEHPDLAEEYTQRGTTRVLLPHGKWLA